MKEISGETFTSISSFITGLSQEQMTEFFTRQKEKQLYVHSYIVNSVGTAASLSSKVFANLLFALIIRCYEYEYGEILPITEKRLAKFMKERNESIVRELKRNSRKKVYNGLRRDAEQRKFIDNLDWFIDGDNENPSGFIESERLNVKITAYLIVFFLNAEMEKIQ